MSNNYNTDQMVTIAGTLGIIFGIFIGVLMNKNNVVAPKQRPLNVDYLHTEQKKEGDLWMWHVYYDDGQFEYETSERTYEGAMRAMRELVNM